MQTLLVLYLGRELLLPGHIEHVLGFEWLRSAIGDVFGYSLSTAGAHVNHVRHSLGWSLADAFAGRPDCRPSPRAHTDHYHGRVLPPGLQREWESGAQVIHDAPGSNFNIDHVILSTRGVYAIETKTWRKSKDRTRIEYDGRRITVSGQPIQYDPLDQCRAQTCWLRDSPKESTTKDLPIRGVVTFPEWWVEQLPGANDSDLWVLNPKALVKWIDRGPAVMEKSDVGMAALHLRQYVRCWKPNAMEQANDAKFG